MPKLVLRDTVKKALYLNQRFYCSNSFDFASQVIPVETKPSELSAERKISKNVISQLEGISLVNFGDEEGIRIVEDAISYANKLDEVQTDGVEPLYTVLEKDSLYLREDGVKSDVNTADLLSHAKKTLEGYYIVPVGNKSYTPCENIITLNNSPSDSNKEEAEKSAY